MITITATNDLNSCSESDDDTSVDTGMWVLSIN
jgi:hypothetical protein